MTAVCEHEAVRRALALEKHGFRRAAIDVLEATLGAEPDIGSLRRLRGVLLSREGRHDEAFAEIQQALVLASLGPEELLILADGYARAGLTASAVDVYQQLADDENRPYEMWVDVFAGLGRAKRWQAALGVCRRAAEVRADDDAVYYAMAQALVRLERPAEMVVSVLCKAIDLNPSDARYRVLLATQLLRTGKQREAYGCIADLAPESFADLTCACCAWKLLRLCISFGDATRAALFGAQLARLAAFARDAQGDARGHAGEKYRLLITRNNRLIL